MLGGPTVDHDGETKRLSGGGPHCARALRLRETPRETRGGAGFPALFETPRLEGSERHRLSAMVNWSSSTAVRKCTLYKQNWGSTTRYWSWRLRSSVKRRQEASPCERSAQLRHTCSNRQFCPREHPADELKWRQTFLLASPPCFMSWRMTPCSLPL